MAPYLVALLLVAGALVLGLAVCRLCGAGWSVAPATGIATMIALSALLIRLPGDAVTAAVVGALVLAAAAALLVRDRGRLGRPDLAAALAGAGALAIVSLQFLAAGHVGLPGQSVNNDTSVHMLWAEGLRSDWMRHLYPFNPGYPLGPHALMAAVAQGTKTSMDPVLVGLLLTTPVLFAISAAGALRPVPLVLRAPAAALSAVTYLAAAWFAQGAFKEPLFALLLLGFGLGLGEVLAPGARLRRASLVPVALIAAGAVLTYSYLAVAWLGATVVLAVGATLILRWPGRAGLVASVRVAAVPVAIAAAAALVAVAVELPRIWRYASAVGSSPANGTGGIGSGELGNLAGPLPTSEVLGIWPAGDFRYPPPPSSFMLDELKALALLAIIGGALYLLDRRRDLGLLSALGAAVAVWWISDRGQSPYVTAKSLAILSPLIGLVTLRALLPVAWPGAGRERLGGAVRVAVAAILGAAGLWSAQIVLRSTPVESLAQRDQLAQLRHAVEPGPTLFLGVDDFAGERLRGVELAYFVTGFPSPLGVSGNPRKVWSYGAPLDWDSVDPKTLDQYRYVVTVRSAYASAPPSNFRLVRQTALYQAWRRTGPTIPRSTIEGPAVPAARLDCRRRAGRRLSRRPGVASVLPGKPLMLGENLPGLGVGGSSILQTRLPRGTWHVAVRYTSTTPVRLMYGPQRIAVLPANTTRPGPYYDAGTIVADGRPQQLVVIAERESRLSRTAYPASVSAVLAVPDGPERVIPLRRACGKLVDWYREQA